MRIKSIGIIIFLVYLIISLVFFHFSLIYFNKVTIPGFSGDSLSFLWGIKWFSYAIINHLNPLISFKLLSPHGMNLAWSPGNSFSADFLSLPVTLIFGPVVSYNAMVILSPALAAFTAYLLCFYLTKKHFPSLIGGYIYGFSSYEFGQLLTHISLFGGIFIMPLIVLIVVAFYRNKIKKLYFIILMTIFLILVWGFSLEIFSTMTFFGYLVITITLALDKEYRRKILSLAKFITLSYMIAMTILLPYIYYLYIGFKFVPKAFHPIAFFSSDLLNYIVPTPITWFGGNFFSHLSAKFTGDFSEDGAYLGIPLIMIFFMYVIKNRDQIYTKIMLLISLVLFISSIGPVLHIAGKEIMTMPWSIMAHVPLIHDALPSRFSLYLFLILSIITALFLSSQKLNKYFKYGIALLSVLFLIPNYTFFVNRFNAGPNIPQFFRKGLYKTYMKRNMNLLIIPYGYYRGNLDILYQIKSNLYFNLTSRLGAGIPLSKWPWINSKLLTSFNQNRPDRINYRVFKSFLASNSIKYIIINLNEYLKWGKLIKFTYKKVGGIFLYRVPNYILNNPNYENYNSAMRYENLKIFSSFYSSSEKFLKDGNGVSVLFPKYLENHDYLNKSFGYHAEHTIINWTQDGGWIGNWVCPNMKGKCFGIGLVGNIGNLQSIIKKYGTQALQIFFPYPRHYNPHFYKKRGQLLMVFRVPESNRHILKHP